MWNVYAGRGLLPIAVSVKAKQARLEAVLPDPILIITHDQVQRGLAANCQARSQPYRKVLCVFSRKYVPYPKSLSHTGRALMVMYARKQRLNDGCHDRKGDSQPYQALKYSSKSHPSGGDHRHDKMRDTTDPSPPNKMLRRSDSPENKYGDNTGHSKAKSMHTHRVRERDGAAVMQNSAVQGSCSGILNGTQLFMLHLCLKLCCCASAILVLNEWIVEETFRVQA
ncbi:UNVERIFIED_CONTAM: hypothetical protein K2H54_024640 [Gekko kuhli]